MNETPFLMYHSEDENVVINALIKDDFPLFVLPNTPI